MEKSPDRKNKFYPEDITALLFSGITLFILAYYVTTGIINDISVLITPAVSLLLFIIIVFYQNRSPLKFLKFLRSYLHIPLYGIIFSAFQVFVHKLNPNDYDYLLLKWDYMFFGFDITVWLEKFISKGLTEVLTLSYFSYYVLPTLTFVLLFFSKKQEAFLNARNYLLAIVLGWYGAFIFYLALPAAGPDIAYPEHYTVPLQGLTPLTNTYLENLGKYLRESFVRNTFPSMHFGIILITNYFAYLYRRKYFWFCTLPLGTLLAIATVYLRQHYLIDLVGSLPVAAISIYIASKLISRNKA
ncbi:MAG: PAP2 superfamily protein [Chlorobi bacterium OLB5]|nr:MAG: PAP2 superfamily protein [Chlorobi bacterium OLB5]